MLHNATDLKVGFDFSLVHFHYLFALDMVSYSTGAAAQLKSMVLPVIGFPYLPSLIYFSIALGFGTKGELKGKRYRNIVQYYSFLKACSHYLKNKCHTIMLFLLRL